MIIYFFGDGEVTHDIKLLMAHAYVKLSHFFEGIQENAYHWLV